MMEYLVVLLKWNAMPEDALGNDEERGWDVSQE